MLKCLIPRVLAGCWLLPFRCLCDVLSPLSDVILLTLRLCLSSTTPLYHLTTLLSPSPATALHSSPHSNYYVPALLSGLRQHLSCQTEAVSSRLPQLHRCEALRSGLSSSMSPDQMFPILSQPFKY